MVDNNKREYIDNPPAVGAPKGWPWGYLPCGCCNDGYGYHLGDYRSPVSRSRSASILYGGLEQ